MLVIDSQRNGWCEFSREEAQRVLDHFGRDVFVGRLTVVMDDGRMMPFEEFEALVRDGADYVFLPDSKNDMLEEL